MGQEVSSSGGIEWTNNGVAICTAIGDQIAPQLCSDGSGGAIITWFDTRNAHSEDNIYGTHKRTINIIHSAPSKGMYYR